MNSYLSQWYANRAKEDYRKACHAIRYLQTYGSTVLGHDYFLKKSAHIPIRIMESAWKSLINQ